MQYLYFLLMVVGIILLIIGVKTIPRLVNTKLLYEMPCVDKEGAFFLPKGMYGIWLSGKLFKNNQSADRKNGSIVNQHSENVIKWIYKRADGIILVPSRRRKLSSFTN